MKRIIITLQLIILAHAAFTQNTAVDKLFDKYAGKEGFTTVIISKQMFELFGQVQTNSSEDKEFKDITSKLNSIRILAYEEKDKKEEGSSINFYKELMKDLPVNEYKELMVIKEKGQDVKFLTREENGKIVELILISGGNDNALISIDGVIDLRTISKLSKSMQIQGMENLDQIKK